METFERFLPNEPIIDTDDFVIYGNSDLEPYKNEISEKLSARKSVIQEYLGLDKFPKATINLFNDHQKYLAYCRQFQSHNKLSYSNSAQGTIDCTYNPKYLENYLFNLINSVTNELVHMMYKYRYPNENDRIAWIYEGLASLLSNEKSVLEKDENEFRNWYIDKIIRRDKVIPDISMLEKPGIAFYDNENGFEGYDIAYLLVRYLNDNYDLKELLKDLDKISWLEPTLLSKCISHYNKLFETDKIKDNFYEIITPEELMDYMNKNIIYGWLDRFDGKHMNNLKGFREIYRTSSIQEILSNRIGCTIEQTKLVKYFFDNMGIENKIFCFRIYENEDNFDKEIIMHCFILYRLKDSWYHFEHSSQPRRGIHKYDSIESAIYSVTSGYEDRDSRILTEIPDVPNAVSFKEFNEYVNSFDNIR